MVSAIAELFVIGHTLPRVMQLAERSAFCEIDSEFSVNFVITILSIVLQSEFNHYHEHHPLLCKTAADRVHTR